jgi:hypothetical protein
LKPATNVAAMTRLRKTSTSTSRRGEEGGIHTGPAPVIQGKTVQFPFNVPGVAGVMLKCVETMTESNYFMSVPHQLLQIYLKEDRDRIQRLNQLQGFEGRVAGDARPRRFTPFLVCCYSPKAIPAGSQSAINLSTARSRNV